MAPTRASRHGALAMTKPPFSLVVAILAALKGGGVRHQIQKLSPDLSVSSISWCILLSLV